MKAKRSEGEKEPEGRASKDVAPPRTVVKHNLELEGAEDADDRDKATGLDYWLGSKEGRKKLFILFWVVSMSMVFLGYGLMLWIATHGGL